MENLNFVDFFLKIAGHNIMTENRTADPFLNLRVYCYKIIRIIQEVIL